MPKLNANETSEVSPVIGLIVPPAAGKVPQEAADIYPGVQFIAAGLGLKEMSIAGYDSVVDNVVGAAEALAADGARVISLMGTSLSFYRGAEFNNSLMESIRSATGLPVTTMSSGTVDALNLLGVRRPAVGTAYTCEVNELLSQFLRDCLIEPASMESLGIAGIDEVHAVAGGEVFELGMRAWEAATDADGILISCGGLETKEVVIQLEKKLGVPVIASPLAGLWASVQLANIDTQAQHEGRLFTTALNGDANE